MNNLGQLIRKLRYLAATVQEVEVKVYKDDMIRLVDAADMGIYLSDVESEDLGIQRAEISRLKQDLGEVVVDRQSLRNAYSNDKARIRILGFKDVDEILTFVEGISAFRKKASGREPVLPAAPYVENPALLKTAMEVAMDDAAKAGNPCAETVAGYGVKDFLTDLSAKAKDEEPIKVEKPSDLPF